MLFPLRFSPSLSPIPLSLSRLGSTFVASLQTLGNFIIKKISIEKSFPIFTQRHKRFAEKCQARRLALKLARQMCPDLPKSSLMSDVLCAIASTNSHNYLKFEFYSEKYLKTRQLIKLAFNSSPLLPFYISLTVVAVSVSASRFASRGNKHIFYASYIFYGTIIFQLEQEPFCLLRAAINEMLQWPSTKLS